MEYKFIIVILLVIAIALFVYKVANNYDKSKKKIQKHIKSGDIIPEDMSEFPIIGDDPKSFVNKIRPAQILYNRFMAGQTLTEEEMKTLNEVLKEAKKTFPDLFPLRKDVRDTLRSLTNK